MPTSTKKNHFKYTTGINNSIFMAKWVKPFNSDTKRPMKYTFIGFSELFHLKHRILSPKRPVKTKSLTYEKKERKEINIKVYEMVFISRLKIMISANWDLCISSKSMR